MSATEGDSLGTPPDWAKPTAPWRPTAPRERSVRRCRAPPLLPVGRHYDKFSVGDEKAKLGARLGEGWELAFKRRSEQFLQREMCTTYLREAAAACSAPLLR